MLKLRLHGPTIWTRGMLSCRLPLIRAGIPHSPRPILPTLPQPSSQDALGHANLITNFPFPSLPSSLLRVQRVHPGLHLQCPYHRCIMRSRLACHLPPPPPAAFYAYSEEDLACALSLPNPC